MWYSRVGPIDPLTLASTIFTLTPTRRGGLFALSPIIPSVHLGHWTVTISRESSERRIELIEDRVSLPRPRPRASSQPCSSLLEQSESRDDIRTMRSLIFLAYSGVKLQVFTRQVRNGPFRHICNSDSDYQTRFPGPSVSPTSVSSFTLSF